MNLSEVFLDELKRKGYTHCFFVAGGNIMHLLNAARSRFECIPTVHEVSAVIATEYFNESNLHAKAFALVTAGPGLTNAITGIAGAWLESRFVLIVGGQVKSTDLRVGSERQRGIQEIDGVTLVSSITKATLRIDSLDKVQGILDSLILGQAGRPGPVFIEICLDLQAAVCPIKELDEKPRKITAKSEDNPDISYALSALMNSERPILLIGGGVSRQFSHTLNRLLNLVEIPTMATWNGLDRVPSNAQYYFGRPNTWGQRYANVLLQQCDLLIAVGTRLGLQQTGFNHESFVSSARVIQVDIDSAELQKGFPRVDYGIEADASLWLETFLTSTLSNNYQIRRNWINFANKVKTLLPISEASNKSWANSVNPYEFVQTLSRLLPPGEVIVPCSSGGAFTVFMQAFEQKEDQVVVSNKGLASMGYGLAGAIGSSIANKKARVILIEGDGGFAQNLQELATVKRQELPIKIFIFNNNGYASIRMTQQNYFHGDYLGCDEESGLGSPDWQLLFQSFQIPSTFLNTTLGVVDQISNFLDLPGPGAMVIPIHQDQTYYPKIESKLTLNGSMQSRPLHLMSPELDPTTAKEVFRFLGEADE